MCHIWFLSFNLFICFLYKYIEYKWCVCYWILLLFTSQTASKLLWSCVTNGHVFKKGSVVSVMTRSCAVFHRSVHELPTDSRRAGKQKQTAASPGFCDRCAGLGHLQTGPIHPAADSAPWPSHHAALPHPARQVHTERREYYVWFLHMLTVMLSKHVHKHIFLHEIK